MIWHFRAGDGGTVIDETKREAMDCAPGEEPEVISLLLEEYKTLRAEITQRLTARIQVVGFTGAVAALLAASSNLSLRRPNLYIAILLLAFAWYWWREMSSGIYRIAPQLRRLERDMNRLAARAYKMTGSDGPFTWETMQQDLRLSAGRTARWRAWLGGSKAGFRRRVSGEPLTKESPGVDDARVGEKVNERCPYDCASTRG